MKTYADETDIQCPECPENFLSVEPKDTYYDGIEYEAICPSCESRYAITAEVQVNFSNPSKLADDEEV